MRTNDLIDRLVADHAAHPHQSQLLIVLPWPSSAGSSISAALFLITLGVRADILAALGTWRFDLKLGGSLLLADRGRLGRSAPIKAYHEFPFRDADTDCTRTPALRGSRL